MIDVLSEKKLRYFEKALVRLRKRILKEIDFEEETIALQPREAAGGVASYGVHMMADQGTDAEEREIAAFLATNDAAILADVDAALRKIIRREEYGICEDCGNPISEKRLRALPHARRCKKCQSMREPS